MFIATAFRPIDLPVGDVARVVLHRELDVGGFLGEHAAAGDHVNHAIAVAHELTAHSPLALRITKQVLNVSLDAPREATLLLEQLAYSVINDASALSDSPSANPAV